MLLSYNRLCELVEQGCITNVEHEQINASSIDLTLGPKILFERKFPAQQYISLKERTPLDMAEYIMDKSCVGGAPHFTLDPGAFVLAHSQQVFNLPRNISAEYKLKSSMARIGLEHLNAGWCDAGWNGSVLTLELKNMTQYHHLVIRPGDFIGQIVFFEHEEVPLERSYAKRGRYNNDKSVKGIKK